MNETELERLVVRLTGDGSEYARMLSQAQGQTNAAAAQIQQASERIEGFSTSMRSFATGAVGALSALGAGGWLRSALGEWSTAENTAAALESAIRSNGGAVESLMARYNDLASELESLTVLGDDSILSIIRQAESFGLSGDAAEQATRNAIALQAATTGSAQGAEHLVRMTAALARGNTQQAMQFARMVPQLRGITDESEFLARANQLIAGGMDAAANEAKTWSGQLTQLKNAYGNLMEEVGKQVAETLAPFVAGIKEVVAWFQKLPAGVKQTIVVIVMLVAAIGTIAAAITVAGVVFNTMFGGIGIIIGLVVTAGVAISAWVSQLGGVQEAWAKIKAVAVPILTMIWNRIISFLIPAWERAKVIGGAVWEWIKVKAVAFWGWAQPIVSAGIAFMIASWQMLKLVVGVVWEWAKTKAMEFWAWTQPIISAGISFAIASWEMLRETAGMVWDWIKTKAMDFWNWAQPIVSAGISFMITSWQLLKEMAVVAWEFIKEAALATWEMILAGATWLWDGIKAVFTGIWDFISGIWVSIFGETEIAWTDIADFIATAINLAEFSLKNFDKVASFVWTLLKLGFAGWVNDIEHFFTTKIPAWLGWFGTNFVAIHVDAFNMVGTMASNLGQSIGNIFRNLPGLIAGTTNWSQVWVPITQGFQATMTALPNIPQRELGALERELTNQAAGQMAELEQLWGEFREQRLDMSIGAQEEIVQELGGPAVLREAERAGREIGNAYGKGAEKGFERFDAVLTKSAEAITRTAEYRDRLGLSESQQITADRMTRQVLQAAANNSSSTISGTGTTSSASQAVSPRGGDSGQQMVVTRLTQIKDLLQILVNRPQIQIEGANL